MSLKSLRLLACLAVAAVSGQALADEGDLVEKVAVRNRLFDVAGRWELGGSLGLQLISRLTDNYNINIVGGYNLNQWFALEGRVGYAISRHTSLADQIQSDFYTNTSVTTANDLGDLWEMNFNAMVGARFQPIYGKINLMAEVPVHFQMYVWVGAGLGLFNRESLVLCTNKTNARECGAYFTQNQAGPLFGAALGMRFFVVNSHHAIKAEVRDTSYLDSYYLGVKRADVTPNSPTGAVTSPTGNGLTNLVQFDFGYTYIF